MDRRSFSKLFLGTVTAAGIPGVNAQQVQRTNATEAKPGKASTACKEHDSAVTNIPASGGSNAWELVVLDAAPPHMTETGAAAAGDIDGDGKTELIVGGNGALLWYRPSTSERGTVALGEFGVGVAVEDIDGDGRMEIVIGKKKPQLPGKPEGWILCWYKAGATQDDLWTEFVFDSDRQVIRMTSSSATWTETASAKWSSMRCTPTIREHMPTSCQRIRAILGRSRPSRPATPPREQRLATSTETASRRSSAALLVLGASRGPFSGQLWKTHSLAPGFREMCGQSSSM